MKVFISWSGSQSKKLAEAIRTWLPGVLQTVEPYFTPNDIEKGNRWSSDIAKELDSSSVGIFCITKENISSPWIMFEAGAISKRVDQSLVCPILFGLGNADISGPLTQFQTTLFDKREIKSLIKTINSSNKENSLTDEVLNEVFDMWWPRLEEKVNAILETPSAESSEVVRTDRDLIEEILDLSRIQVRHQGIGQFSESQENLYSRISTFLSCFHLVFDEDWEHTSLSLGDVPEYVVSRTGTFISPKVGDESNNWSNRGALLESYRDLISYIRENNIDIDPYSHW